MEKRKTINGEDILFAMTTLGFDNYVEPLKLYLQKYREATKGDKVLQNTELVYEDIPDETFSEFCKISLFRLLVFVKNSLFCLGHVFFEGKHEIIWKKIKTKTFKRSVSMIKYANGLT